MTLSASSDERPVGVIGAGNFGSAVANLIGKHRKVLLFVRNEDTLKRITSERMNRGHKMHRNVRPVDDLRQIAERCNVIFPIVPSIHFRPMVRKLSPHLHPYHILIHGTKGLDVQLPKGKKIKDVTKIDRSQVKTMSEVLREETVVVRVGCLAGPNLSRELAAGHPAATVVASHFNEVIAVGKKLLRNDRFQVYGNNDLIGVELAGVLKNIIAIASGALTGMGHGENARGLLISRGVVEMIHLGKAMGGDVKAFLGVAGVGDLVATCNSQLSRNFSVGFQLAKGKSLETILSETDEIAEGIHTVLLMKKLVDFYRLRAPITSTLYKVLFEDLTVRQALHYLMRYPLNVDIDFL